MNVYKIRFPDGTFSTGGSSPKRSKKGKTWNSLGNIKSHLRLLWKQSCYQDAEIIVFEVTEVDTGTISISDVMTDMKKAADKRKAEQEIRRAKNQRERAEQMIRDANKILNKVNK